MSEKVNVAQLRRATLAERAANLLCWGRITAAPIIAEHAIINPDHKSWLFGGAVAAIGTTDKVDGILGRWAAKVKGVATSVRGAWLDQLSDKVYVHGALGGIAVGAFAEGHPVFGAACLANQAVVVARDVWVTKARKRAETGGADTKARWLGKLKTVLQMGVISVATSPIADLYSGESINGGELLTASALTATTALAIGSGVSLVRNMHQQTEQITQIDPLELLAETSIAA